MNIINPQHALLQFLIQFHIRRDYFECHEVLEEYWKTDGKGNPIWVGLIQFATAFYHYRRNNYRGAEKLFIRARETLNQEQIQLEKLGFISNAFIELINETIKRVNSNQPYQSVHIPISDTTFVQALTYANRNNVTPSHDEEEYIKNKHKLRDRSTIIQERHNALLERKIKR